MPRILQRSVVVAATVLATVIPTATVMAGDTTTSTLAPSTTISPTYDLENDPSLCINSNPRPNCGKKVTQAGDRGGALQFVLFGILLSALAFIGIVIGRNVVRRDREVTSRMQGPTSDNT